MTCSASTKISNFLENNDFASIGHTIAVSNHLVILADIVFCTHIVPPLVVKSDMHSLEPLLLGVLNMRT